MGQELHRLSGQDWDKLVESWSTSLSDFCDFSQDQNERTALVFGEDVLFDRHLSEIVGVQLGVEAEKVLRTLLQQVLSYLSSAQQSSTTMDEISVYSTDQPLSEKHGDSEEDDSRTSGGNELQWPGPSTKCENLVQVDVNLASSKSNVMNKVILITTQPPFIFQTSYREGEELILNPTALCEDNTHALCCPTWEADTSDTENDQYGKTKMSLPWQLPLLDMLNSRTSETPDYLCRFKKMMPTVWKTIVNHRFSGPFMKPVSDKQAPGYWKIVKQPMDLSTIKRGLTKGKIKSTVEFQRDVMLVFQNAVMYNSSTHPVYHKAVEMQRDMKQVLQWLYHGHINFGPFDGETLTLYGLADIHSGANAHIPPMQLSLTQHFLLQVLNGR